MSKPIFSIQSLNNGTALVKFYGLILFFFRQDVLVRAQNKSGFVLIIEKQRKMQNKLIFYVP